MLKQTGRKIAQRLGLRVKKQAPLPARKSPAKLERTLRLSLVVPTYNVEAYIDRFLDSVFTQTSLLKSFEVIVVDDGSTDRSAEIVKEWQARYPKHLRYVYQENAGASSARNTGLALAKGTWVGFPDPDDFLDENYFRKMLKEIEREHKKPLLAVCSNMIFYFEDQDIFSDSHPLKYKFASKTVRKSTSNLGNFIHLSGATIWLHRETVISHGLKFEKRVRPSFEDAHFMNKLFVLSPQRTVSFVPSARYYYRKRLNKTSQVDTARAQRAWFIDKYEHGILDLLKHSQENLGTVPRFIQRTCLYEVFWSFRHLVNHEERANFLDREDRDRFLRLMREVFTYIDADVIKSFELAGCTEEHRVALLSLFKDQRRDSTAIYVEKNDSAAGIMQFSYFTGGLDDFTVQPLVNDREVKAQFPSKKSSEFLGINYFTQNFFWVSFNDGDTISFSVEDSPCRIRRGGRSIGHEADWLTLRNALRKPVPHNHSEETSRLRNHVIANQEKYRDCMVLMDRDDRADDNAEHLYRHMMRTGRDGNAWFVLDRDSKDWIRLEKEGFRLLPFGSDDHIAAQMNAAVLISSHADHYVLWPVSRGDFADLARYEFVFLQHGISMNDLSAWLNRKPIRLFVTSMPSEEAHISDSGSPYVFTKREVLFSGLPRHDSLVDKSRHAAADTILVMPTWRKYLTVEGEVTGMRRTKQDDFTGSLFARSWSAVLDSDSLRQLAEKHGMKVVFAPHPNMAMYLEDMNLPAWVETVDVRNGVSYQNLLSRARVAVTDYSSALMEVAYLQRPVVYFQFDFHEFFAGEHICKPGYFSFERDGFGPVVQKPKDVIACLEDALSGRENPVYAERRDNAFPFRDGGCCERVCTAIERLFEPRPALSPLYTTQVAPLALLKTGAERSVTQKAARYFG
ncbi:bifunctional glycosyltransferase/CDP-glycerol:glycerophosphate glycerophosphotransferase [Paracoccus shandongensis]|uniref:bifunctional glycosyltransferase/CDP-glycerol:glycerophosphate glycerophosphotransferase n=1 Tax=Paracoccus shandongensis TaxID=2816048 RepID=UPI001A8D105F|nr:glycosyltransferase [Paracoccus shandongensis]